MTRNEKKAVIESMAEKFMNIDDLEGKSMTIMVMSAYAEVRQREKQRSVADGNRKRQLQPFNKNAPSRWRGIHKAGA